MRPLELGDSWSEEAVERWETWSVRFERQYRGSVVLPLGSAGDVLALLDSCESCPVESCRSGKLIERGADVGIAAASDGIWVSSGSGNPLLGNPVFITRYVTACRVKRKLRKLIRESSYCSAAVEPTTGSVKHICVASGVDR